MERVRFTREQIEDMLARARRGGHYGINAGLGEALAAQLLEYMRAYAAQREVEP